MVWTRLGLDVSWGRAAAGVAVAAAAGRPHSHPGTTCTQNSSTKRYIYGKMVSKMMRYLTTYFVPWSLINFQLRLSIVQANDNIFLKQFD